MADTDRLLSVMNNNRKVFDTWTFGLIRRDVWLMLMGLMDTWDLEKIQFHKAWEAKP